MDHQFTTLIAAVFGLFLGMAIAWFALLGRIATAFGTGRSEGQVELATSKERVRSLEEERLQSQTEHDGLNRQINEWREANVVVRDEKAKLSERASRVATLESDLASALDLVKTAQREILRLSMSEAEKAQSLHSTQNRIVELNATYLETQRQLEIASVSLSEVNERYVGVEVRASRVPTLEEEITDKEKLNITANRDLATLREESGRLQAELKAERATLEATTTRLATLQQQLREENTSLLQSRQSNAEHGATISRLEAELVGGNMAISAAREELRTEKEQHKQAQVKVNQLATQSAELNANLDAERGQNVEKIALLTEAREQLSLQFKSLANDILEEKSKRFTEHNQTNIGQLLTPLKERMSEFKTKVEEIHAKDIEQQATLRAELAQLKDLNRQMTDEAHGLATALKGQAKKQGNWGELVLGNVLDRAGLCEGKDYRREVSFNTEEGRKRPDVVVSLPQNKHLVIDAKVSLNAYTRYVNADDDQSREVALKEHVAAISSRIQELSNRAYFELPGLNTPEMVFMFIPIESAFVEALRADEGLFQRAIENNILVATPTTLLTSLNIVRQLWRFEVQNANTAELADRAGKVYKKLVTFLGSLEAVGRQLDKAKESYSTALGQLYSGKGNLIQQARDFERLGVSVQSQLPEHLVVQADLEIEHIADLIDVTP